MKHQFHICFFSFPTTFQTSSFQFIDFFYFFLNHFSLHSFLHQFTQFSKPSLLFSHFCILFSLFYSSFIESENGLGWKGFLVQLPYHGQVHLSLDQVAQSSVQPGFEPF